MQFHASLTAEPLFRFDLPVVGAVTITNTILTTWIVMAILLGLVYAGTRHLHEVPTGLQNFWEAVLDGLPPIWPGLYPLVAGTAGHYARTIFPLIATLFIFILTANWFALLPGVGTILWKPPPEVQAVTSQAAGADVKHKDTAQRVTGQKAEKEAKEKHAPEMVPLFRAANSDLNTTLGMALLSFLAIQASGIRVHGIVGFFKEYASPVVFLAPIKVAIEMFIPVSLSFRLFGNIFGGEVLLTVMGLPFVAVIFMTLEVLFGLIQAAIFSMLTLIFISLMVAEQPGAHGGLGAHAEPTGGAAEPVPAH